MSTTKDKIRAAAQKYLQKGQLDKAVKEFEALIVEDPSDVRTLLKIGELQAKLGEKDKAIKTYTQVAVVYENQGFLLKSVAVYKQVLKIENDLPPVHKKLIEDYQKLGLHTEALGQVRELGMLFQKKGLSKELAELKQLASEILAQQKPKSAEEPKVEGAPVAPTSAPPSASETPAAEPEQKPAEIKEPENDFNLLEELRSELNADEDIQVEKPQELPFDTMFDAFKKGVSAQIDTEDFESHYTLGIAYKEMGLLEDALREFKQSVNSPKYEIASLTMLGLCLMEQGNTEEALTYFNQGLNSERLTEHETLNLRFEIASTYESMGRRGEALRFYQKASEMNPDFRNANKQVERLQADLIVNPEAKAEEVPQEDNEILALDLLLEDVAQINEEVLPLEVELEMPVEEAPEIEVDVKPEPIKVPEPVKPEEPPSAPTEDLPLQEGIPKRKIFFV